MRPLLGALEACMAGLSTFWLVTVTGGAKAAATSGFDCVGGGGAIGALTGGAGVVALLGSLTVAMGFSEVAC